MSNHRKSLRISMDDLVRVAAQGVERALDARKAAGIELSEEEVEEVGGGGYTFAKDIGIIAGGIRPDILQGLQGGLSVPVVETAGFASAGFA